MSSLSVIIPSRTASNLIACVDAIRKNEPNLLEDGTPPIGTSVFVIDDGLDLATAGGSLNDCGRIVGRKPFIFSRNVNLGITSTGSDDVIVCNDDAQLLSPSGFTVMQHAAEEHPEYGIISATTNVAGNLDQRPKGIGLRDAGDRTVAFVCVLIPRRTIEAVGLLDERFTAYGWEDNDYCRRVRMAGLKVGIHDGCYVDHGSLVSTYRGGAHAAGDIEPGRRIFEAKWGTV